MVQGGAGETRLIEDGGGAFGDQLTGQLPPGGHVRESPIARSGIRGRMKFRPRMPRKSVVMWQAGGGLLLGHRSSVLRFTEAKWHVTGRPVIPSWTFLGSGERSRNVPGCERLGRVAAAFSVDPVHDVRRSTGSHRAQGCASRRSRVSLSSAWWLSGDVAPRPTAVSRMS